MKTKKSDYSDDKQSYYIKFEELIGIVFSILNCTDEVIDKMPFDIFNEYIKCTKIKFEENMIKIESSVSYFDWREIEEHGIFTPYQNDFQSHHYDGMRMLKHLSQKELEEKYKQHPKECLAILTDEDITNHIIQCYNSRSKKCIKK